MLTMSDLPQRMFDDLTEVMGRTSLMSPEEIELVAASIEAPGMTGDPEMRAALKAMAYAIRMCKEC